MYSIFKFNRIFTSILVVTYSIPKIIFVINIMDII